MPDITPLEQFRELLLSHRTAMVLTEQTTDLSGIDYALDLLADELTLYEQGVQTILLHKQNEK